jgi:hypothetical protein
MFDGLRQLLRRHPEQLKNLDFRVSAAEIPNRGTYYRLKAGPFPSAQAAKAACRAFRRKNTYCVASDFAGNPVVQ